MQANSHFILMLIDHDDQSRGFLVYDAFANASEEATLLYNNTAASGYRFTHTFNPTLILRYLEINSTTILTICEFELVEGVCDLGTFGQSCKSRCHCFENASCNNVDGYCSNGRCAPGWQGTACDTECDKGTFGNCTSVCHCYLDASCDSINGVCSNGMCAQGWQGASCDRECDKGTFGRNCTSVCHCSLDASCDSINGVCSNGMCAPGWQGSSCNRECDKGTFGNCASVCHCYLNASCDSISGVCSNGMCAPGWQGSSCDIECTGGMFGQNCSFECHCAGNQPCHHISGSCHGNCSQGWKGSNCSIDANLIRQIRTEVTVSASSHWSTWTADKAIDFKYSSPPVTCDCCSAITIMNTTAWWMLDLGNTYPIQTIIFIGRNDASSYQSRGFEIYTSLQNINSDKKLTYNNSSPTGYQFVIPLSPDIFRYLEVVKPDILTICEIRLLQSDLCPASFYGPYCQQRCHCNDTRPCSRTIGFCQTPGCEPGWKGESCNAECAFGRFGINCSDECHCYRNASCDNVNGTCSNAMCAPGWEGTTCSKECGTGTFGLNCSSVCHCLHNKTCDYINGSCPNSLCAPGWQGGNCSIVCGDGTFGPDCAFPCHCLDNKPCQRFNGSCPSGLCAPGWHGDNCIRECNNGTFGHNCISLCHCFQNHSCDTVSGICPSSMCASGWNGASCHEECSENTFGQNCSSKCHCVQADVCHHINGSCTSGGCETGWEGGNCSVESTPMTGSADNPPVGVIVGPLVAVVAILIVVTAVILYRKRLTPKKAENSEQTFLDLSDNIRSDSKPTQELQNKMTTTGASRGKEKEPVQLKEDHAYYTFDSKETKIQLSELWNYINLAYNTKCEKLYEEFQKLPSGLVNDCNEARKIENAKKTRYKQMYAYDHSRVILNRDDGNASTYINASYIDGYRTEKKFIASQGPTEAMVSDFWDMVIQEKSTVIVMLTNVIEHAAVKCLQYWATEEGEQQIFGDVKVATSKITTFPDYIIRELVVTKGIQKSIRITQAHFTAWPDKDVPDAAWHLVNFWRKVNALVGMKKQPIIVHCSAGIGRTGTYIALDNLHAQAKAEGYIQPLGVVKRMRHQRVNMVQTKEQYVFLHEAIAESLFLGVKCVKANAFEAVFKFLLEADKSTGTTGLEQQYQITSKTSRGKKDSTKRHRQGHHKRQPGEQQFPIQFLQDSLNSTAAESEYYNVSLATESDEYRPKGSRASIADRNEQPSTCYIQNYAGKSSYIMTKAPETDTVEQLWSLVLKHGVKTILTFHKDIERNEKMNHERHKGQNKDEHSNPKVTLLDTNQEKQYIVKTFEVTGSKSDKGSRTIKQFVFTTWKERSDVPMDAASAITFLNAVQRWQPTVDEAHPVLINCESGFERSALICILLNEFERVRLKEEVHILETVKRMKERNTNLTPDYEQYKFCYSAVLEYIRQSDVYMNV